MTRNEVGIKNKNKKFNQNNIFSHQFEFFMCMTCEFQFKNCAKILTKVKYENCMKRFTGHVQN